MRHHNNNGERDQQSTKFKTKYKKKGSQINFTVDWPYLPDLVYFLSELQYKYYVSNNYRSFLRRFFPRVNFSFYFKLAD